MYYACNAAYARRSAVCVRLGSSKCCIWFCWFFFGAVDFAPADAIDWHNCAVAHMLGYLQLIERYDDHQWMTYTFCFFALLQFLRFFQVCPATSHCRTWRQANFGCPPTNWYSAPATASIFDQMNCVRVWLPAYTSHTSLLTKKNPSLAKLKLKYNDNVFDAKWRKKYLSNTHRSVKQ